jgi:N-acetyl-anhydromuramyl-L-alanine amidase AmpD
MYINPNIIQYPSPNCNTGRAGFPILLLVFHREQGTEAGTDAWFANRNAQVSSHYSMDSNGQVYQHVADENEAWANGLPPPCVWIVQEKNPLALHRPGVDPNLFTLSMEVSGWAPGSDPRGTPITAAQLSACVAWAKEKCAAYSIPIDRDRIVGHGEIGGHPNCPGADFPLDLIVAEANA